MKQKTLPFLAILLFIGSSLFAQPIGVVASGFATPVGLQVSADGSVWITQTGTGNDDGKVSLFNPADSSVHDVITGLPSLFSAATGEIIGAWRSYELPNNRLLVVSGEGEHPLAGTLLTFDLTGFTPGDAPKTLNDFEDTLKINDYVLGLSDTIKSSNPYSVAWNASGDMFVVDAGGNMVLNADMLENTLSVFVTFPSLVNPTPVGAPVIDYVPTKLISDGADGFYLVNLTGFPFVDSLATLKHISADGTVTTVAGDLSLVVDIAVDPTDGNLVVLQFADFDLAAGGFLPASARLTKIYENGSRAVVANGFGPSAGFAFAANGEVYVSGLMSGEISKISLDATAVRETWPEDAILISPNPTSDILTIKTEDISDKRLTVFVRDFYGRILLTESLQGNYTELNVARVPAGNYLLEIRGADKFAVRRFVKL